MKCDHIIGQDKLTYELSIIRKSDPIAEYDYIYNFNFCPCCGEKLEKVAEE